jgi:catechol 2,3-dioxygenase-like lactoylglutathione lyase family enzyme
MEPHIDVITLAVRDLDRSLAFYRDGLGLETPGVTGTRFVGDEANPAGAVLMFRLEGGLVLALYPRSELAKDAGVPFGPPKTGELSLGHLVEKRADVDALLAQAEKAGATLTGQPTIAPGGSTPATFATPTDISGRSSGARRATTARHDGHATPARRGFSMRGSPLR